MSHKRRAASVNYNYFLKDWGNLFNVSPAYLGVKTFFRCSETGMRKNPAQMCACVYEKQWNGLDALFCA